MSQSGSAAHPTRLTVKEIDRHVAPDTTGEEMLKRGISPLGLSAHGDHRILSIARTIAAPARAERLTATHIAEPARSRGTA
jgi:magnesium chelatase family protein